MIRYLVAFVSAGLLLLAAACSSLPGYEKDASPAQRLLGVEQQYATAFVFASHYENLPRCVQGSVKVCSKQSVVDEMRKTHKTVKAALDQAWDVVYAVDSLPDDKYAAVDAVAELVKDAVARYNSVKNVLD